MRTGWPRPAVVSGVVAVLVIAVVLIAVRQNRDSTQRADAPVASTPAASAAASPSASVEAPAPLPTRTPRLRACVTTEIPLQDVADLLHLPSAQQAGPIVGQAMPSIYSSVEGVERHYVAYSMSGGAVSRRIELIGPDDKPRIDNYYDPVNDLYDDTPTEKSGATIRGIERGFWVNPSNSGGEPSIFVYWTEPDGKSWAALSDGITAAQMRSALASIDIGNGRVRTGTVPSGFSEWERPIVRSAQDKPIHAVQANYHQLKGNAAWEFFVNDGKYAEQAPFRGEPIRIGSEPGWWTPPSPEYRIGGIVNWDHKGLHFMFRAWSDPQLPRDQALAIAESVTKISPSDPLLFAGCKR